MNYFRQVYYEMKHQRMMTWVSVSGTALAIFLVMTFFMTENVKTVEMPPETNRSRIVTGANIEIRNEVEKWSSSNNLSYNYCRKLYENLDGVEQMSIFYAYPILADVETLDKSANSLMLRYTDDKYWKIYDFNFLHGSPFGKEELDSDRKVAVLTRSAARSLFQKEDVVGSEIKILHIPYSVVGVVEDVAPMLRSSYAEIYVPLNRAVMTEDNPTGECETSLLMKPGTDINDLRKQVEARYAVISDELKKNDQIAVYHGQPYDAETMAKLEIYSNLTPDLRSKHTSDIVVYVLLLLLPAINLSSMMSGRLKHRISEIGVRRAFGAKRKSIVLQLLGENLIVTLSGGLIGLALSVLFMLFAADIFFKLTADTLPGMIAAAPTVGMLFTWHTFFVALGACLVLNIMSAGIPAWKASCVEPALAIAKAKS